MPSLPDEVVETTNEIRNEYDFRGGILTALGQEYTASDVRDKETFRQKLLTGLSQEYTQDDIKQTDLFRDKVVTGLSGLASGGGGGDFSTAEVTIDNSNNSKGYPEIYGSTVGQVNIGGLPPTYEYSSRPDIFPSNAVQTYTVILYKGKAMIRIPDPTGIGYNVTTSGNITSSSSGYIVTGDCTITIS